MTVGFISTVQGHQWPGSEYLWSACAEQLLAVPHQVVVSASADLHGAPALENLRAKGAVIALTSPAAGRAGRLRQKLLNPFRKFSRRNLDLMVVSSGCPYDPVYQPALGEFLCATEIPFLFICHFNAETFWVDEPMRAMMTAIFQQARATVFVSRENQRLTERSATTNPPAAFC